MNGHEQIVSLRASGFKPAAVFVEDGTCAATGWELDAGCLPTVYVGGDTPALSDLRFLIGCRVHLHADDAKRAGAWVSRLVMAGVPHVIQSTQGEITEWRA